jgi:hypothetical protein
MAIAAIFLWAIASGSCTLIEAGHASLSEDVIRIRDVAELSCVAPGEREAIGALVVAASPRRSVSLQRDALAALIRRRAPILAGIEGDQRLIRFDRQRIAGASPHCAFARAPLPAGAILTEADVERAPCSASNETASLDYDRLNQILRTRESVSAGGSFGRLAPLPAAAIESGAPIAFVASVGVVRIERRVAAAQSARAGERIFVRAASGETFALPFPAAAP